MQFVLYYLSNYLKIWLPNYIQAQPIKLIVRYGPNAFNFVRSEQDLFTLTGNRFQVGGVHSRANWAGINRVIPSVWTRPISTLLGGLHTFSPVGLLVFSFPQPSWLGQAAALLLGCAQPMYIQFGPEHTYTSLSQFFGLGPLIDWSTGQHAYFNWANTFPVGLNLLLYYGLGPAIMILLGTIFQFGLGAYV